MSFWNDPFSSFQGFFDDPWQSMQNFGTTGLVPLIPAVAGAVGGVYGGPAGAVAAGSAAQSGVDYFGGNSEARTGKGIGKSIGIGGAKGYLGSLGADYGADWFSQLGGGDGGGILGSLGGEGGGSFIPSAGSGANFGIDAGGSYGLGGGGYGVDIFGGGGYGADIFGGYSPTGSDAGFSGSQLSPEQIMNLNSNPYTPEYLDKLAFDNGVDAGNPTLWDRLTGNTEQNLYKQEGLAKQASGKTISDLLKKQAQQKAIGQLAQSGSKMQQQNDAQQADTNRMAQLQAMMRKGQNVDVASSLLALLQDKKQQSKQPRISLI
jgi:hypothetical protein